MYHQGTVEASAEKSEWGDCSHRCLLKVSEIMVLMVCFSPIVNACLLFSSDIFVCRFMELKL